MYPEPTNIWESLEFSSVGTFIAESLWVFPTLETLHVIALATVIGTIAVLDLRLLGLASRKVAITALSKEILPWTWAGFALAALTGLLLFTSRASDYIENLYFLCKMGLLVLAGLNMLLFHFITSRSIEKWDHGNAAIPVAAKAAGLISLVFWAVIVFLGRAIGFTLDIFF
jgi:uncharacterized membrane protein